MNEEIDSKSVPEELELSSELQYITSGEVSEPIEVKSEVNESDDSIEDHVVMETADNKVVSSVKPHKGKGAKRGRKSCGDSAYAL